ncbi:hypothetical protein RJ640_028649 [Escallonia rubra]|uniref:Leucine-rich repeat-containing N-terminal plant-type domain-containing protein n=1 Tax=Escallonia rubra TaxID=112253 RepID=A0AA88QPV5_9ASTE|nr:hypothetical protein RJ640_028649 [Escallonia rubra]
MVNPAILTLKAKLKQISTNWLAIALAWILLHLTTPAASLSSDGLSLLALKVAITTDPTQFLAGWSESDSTPCHWARISCDRDRRVTSIFLPNRSFTGYIPSELDALLYLKRLSLSNNNLSKPIPVHLFNASSLLSVDLSCHSLSVPVPH